jgi:hypothetical protein
MGLCRNVETIVVSCCNLQPVHPNLKSPRQVSSYFHLHTHTDQPSFLPPANVRNTFSNLSWSIFSSANMEYKRSPAHTQLVSIKTTIKSRPTRIVTMEIHPHPWHLLLHVSHACRLPWSHYHEIQRCRHHVLPGSHPSQSPHVVP